MGRVEKFSDAQIETILKKISQSIGNSGGVRVCINKRSRNFENWIQIELCNILSSDPFLFPINQLGVEQRPSKESNKSVDVVVNDQNGYPQIGIEIKILMLGGAGGNARAGINKDIVTLTELPSKQNLLLWVIYEKEDGALPTWEKYKPRDGKSLEPVSVFEKKKDGVNMILFVHVL